MPCRGTWFPLPQHSQLIIPSGVAPRWGKQGFTCNPELKYFRFTCSLLADCKNSVRAVSSLDNPHWRAGTFDESNFICCISVFIREWEGVAMEARITLWNKDAVIRPARCLYHNGERDWSCVDFSRYSASSFEIFNSFEKISLQAMVSSSLNMVVYFDFFKDVRGSGSLRTIRTGGVDDLGNGAIDECITAFGIRSFNPVRNASCLKIRVGILVDWFLTIGVSTSLPCCGLLNWISAINDGSIYMEIMI